MAQKVGRTLGAPKSPWRKSGYLLISMRLKCNHRTTLAANRGSPKVPAIPSNGKFGKDTKIGHFLKFFKGGTKGKSLKK